MYGKQPDEFRILRGINLVYSAAIFGTIYRMYQPDDSDHTTLGRILFDRGLTFWGSYLRDDTFVGLNLYLSAFLEDRDPHENIFVGLNFEDNTRL